MGTGRRKKGQEGKERGKRGNRRKRQQFIEYDYEELYNYSLDNWDEYFINQLLETGKVKSVYATKETYAGDQLEIEIYPEFSKQQAEAEGIPEVDRKKQKEQQRKLNSKNSRKQFWRLCEHNFNSGDLWITLTYAEEPESIDEAIKNVQRFIRCINGKRRRRGLPNAKYLYVTEEVSEEGRVVRIHHHLFMDAALPVDEVMKTWKHGGRNEYRQIEKDDNGIKGAATYTTKEKADTKRRKYQKRWNGSTNLEKPPEKKHHQTKQKDVDRMVTDRDYIREYVENAKTRSGKLRYGGYVYTGSDVYFNDFNARFYIRVRMRKGEKEDEGQKEGTGKEAVYRRGTDRVPADV